MGAIEMTSGGIGEAATTSKRTAIGEMVAHYERLVYSVCRRVLKSDAEARDACQDTFIRLAQNLRLVNRNEGAWVYKCAYSTALNRLNSEAARRNREREWIAANQDTQECPTMLYDAIGEAMAALPESDRELVVLHFYEGKTQADIAKAIGVSAMAVSKRMRSALDSLRLIAERKVGAAVGAAALTSYLSEQAFSAVPPPGLSAELEAAVLALKASPVAAMTAASISKALSAAAVVFMAMTAGGYLLLNHGVRLGAAPPRSGDAVEARSADDADKTPAGAVKDKGKVSAGAALDKDKAISKPEPKYSSAKESIPAIDANAILNMKLQKFIIDHIEFEEVSMETISQLLSQRSKDIDPHGEGVSIRLNDSFERQFSMVCDKIPLGEVIGYVCRKAEAVYEFKDGEIVIHSISAAICKAANKDIEGAIAEIERLAVEEPENRIMRTR